MRRALLIPAVLSAMGCAETEEGLPEGTFACGEDYESGEPQYCVEGEEYCLELADSEETTWSCLSLSGSECNANSDSWCTCMFDEHACIEGSFGCEPGRFYSCF